MSDDDADMLAAGWTRQPDGSWSKRADLTPEQLTDVHLAFLANGEKPLTPRQLYKAVHRREAPPDLQP